MAEAYIYDAVRSPRGRGRKDGALHEVTSLALAAQILQAVQARSELDTRQLDDVILGVVAPVGEQGADIARIALLTAGYAESVAGLQINRYCASGLEACNIAAAKIISGEAELVVAGGVESMSRVPMGADGGAFDVDPAAVGANHYIGQGVAADLIATLYGFSRTDVDGYAVQSQLRAARAWEERRFEKSIVPVKDQIGLPLLERDEHMRPGTSLESLRQLKPVFEKIGAAGFDAVAIQRYPGLDHISHVHHAGNSSGIVDGASAVLIGSRGMGDRLGLKPRARIKGMASIGSEPTIMLTGPELVTQKLLRRLGMTVADVDLFELNEAFAAVVLRMMQALDIPHEKMNVNGGAIAMGHPLGATGAMLVGTALDELERQGKATALITLCAGLGLGTAMLIERI